MVSTAMFKWARYHKNMVIMRMRGGLYYLAYHSETYNDI